jgi:hypothetical protein
LPVSLTVSLALEVALTSNEELLFLLWWGRLLLWLLRLLWSHRVCHHSMSLDIRL